MFAYITIACILGAATAAPSYGGNVAVGSVDIPRYGFNYAVNDPITGDNKAQTESREGGVVKGSYSLSEPDGTIRVVEYAADPVSGFNAIVKRVGPAAHPQVLPIVQKQIAPVVAAPVAAVSAIPNSLVGLGGLGIGLGSQAIGLGVQSVGLANNALALGVPTVGLANNVIGLGASGLGLGGLGWNSYGLGGLGLNSIGLGGGLGWKH